MSSSSSSTFFNLVAAAGEVLVVDGLSVAAPLVVELPSSPKPVKSSSSSSSSDVDVDVVEPASSTTSSTCNFVVLTAPATSVDEL